MRFVEYLREQGDLRFYGSVNQLVYRAVGHMKDDSSQCSEQCEIDSSEGSQVSLFGE